MEAHQWCEVGESFSGVGLDQSGANEWHWAEAYRRRGGESLMHPYRAAVGMHGTVRDDRSGMPLLHGNTYVPDSCDRPALVCLFHAVKSMCRDWRCVWVWYASAPRGHVSRLLIEIAQRAGMPLSKMEMYAPGLMSFQGFLIGPVIRRLMWLRHGTLPGGDTGFSFCNAAGRRWRAMLHRA